MLATLLALALAVPAPVPGDCDELLALVRRTYTFRPSKLSPKERERASEAMDRVWDAVKANRDVLAPCLEDALRGPKADPWFRVDASALLVEVAPTEASKRLQVELWSAADLDDLDPEVWLGTLCLRANEGFDVSAAGARWLSKPETFSIAEHALEVGRRNGARFLYGSMDEAAALEALVGILASAEHPGRDVALDLVACLATPEALGVLRKADLSTFSKPTRDAISPLLARPGLLEKRTPRAGTTRAEVKAALEAFLEDDPEPLLESQTGSEHWAAEVAGALEPEDLPLLRRVRRKRMTYLSDEALEDYRCYTTILMTFVWKPELVR